MVSMMVIVRPTQRVIGRYRCCLDMMTVRYLRLTVKYMWYDREVKPRQNDIERVKRKKYAGKDRSHIVLAVSVLVTATAVAVTAAGTAHE